VVRLWAHKDSTLVALGAAVGKLRRLKDLALDLGSDGRTYHAFAQVKSGGRFTLCEGTICPYLPW
jgi:hypothetical protein